MGTSISIPQHLQERISKRSRIQKHKQVNTCPQMEDIFRSIYLEESAIIEHHSAIQTTRENDFKARINQQPSLKLETNASKQGGKESEEGEENLPLDSINDPLKIQAGKQTSTLKENSTPLRSSVLQQHLSPQGRRNFAAAKTKITNTIKSLGTVCLNVQEIKLYDLKNGCPEEQGIKNNPPKSKKPQLPLPREKLLRSNAKWNQPSLTQRKVPRDRRRLKELYHEEQYKYEKKKINLKLTYQDKENDHQSN